MPKRTKIISTLVAGILFIGLCVLGVLIKTGKIKLRALLPTEITNTASVEYYDTSGKKYTGSSNTLTTPIKKLASLVLKMTLQGRPAGKMAVSVTVFVLQPGTETQVATATVNSDGDGNITISDISGWKNVVLGNTYDIAIKVDGFLRRKLKNITIPPSTTPDFGQVLVGDYNKDNKVDTGDIAIWVAYFRKTATTGDPKDINQDGKIDTADVAIWVSNFRKVGE